jgi:hypothetical protein
LARITGVFGKRKEEKNYRKKTYKLDVVGFFAPIFFVIEKMVMCRISGVFCSFFEYEK